MLMSISLHALRAPTDGADEFNRTEAIRDFAALLATSEIALRLLVDLRGKARKIVLHVKMCYYENQYYVKN
jgi:hypothetical protein